MAVVKKITKVIAWILTALTVLVTAAMLGILVWQVFARYVLKNSTGWTSELTTILFVWASMLGAALAVKAGGHVAMTMLVSKLKGKLQTVVKLISMLLCEVFFYIVFSGGLTMVTKFKNVVTTQLRIPMPYVYSAYLVSGAFMLIFGLEIIITYIIDLVKSNKKTEDSGGDN